MMVGDNLYVKGSTHPDGTVNASWVWDNIRWQRGHIARVREGGLVLATTSGNRFVDMHALQPLVQTNNRVGAPTRGFKRGQWVDALGLAQRSGNLDATRIWVAAPGQTRTSHGRTAI